jgi:hypothetical protein
MTHYTPFEMRIQDNKFVEECLQASVGGHKEFMKQWRMVFWYTSSCDRPVLVLNRAW